MVRPSPGGGENEVRVVNTEAKEYCSNWLILLVEVPNLFVVKTRAHFLFWR